MEHDSDTMVSTLLLILVAMRYLRMIVSIFHTMIPIMANVDHQQRCLGFYKHHQQLMQRPSRITNMSVKVGNTGYFSEFILDNSKEAKPKNNNTSTSSNNSYIKTSFNSTKKHFTVIESAIAEALQTQQLKTKEQQVVGASPSPSVSPIQVPSSPSASPTLAPITMIPFPTSSPLPQQQYRTKITIAELLNPVT